MCAPSQPSEPYLLNKTYIYYFHTSLRQGLSVHIFYWIPQCIMQLKFHLFKHLEFQYLFRSSLVGLNILSSLNTQKFTTHSRIPTHFLVFRYSQRTGHLGSFRFLMERHKAFLRNEKHRKDMSASLSIQLLELHTWYQPFSASA